MTPPTTAQNIDKPINQNNSQNSSNNSNVNHNPIETPKPTPQATATPKIAINRPPVNKQNLPVDPPEASNDLFIFRSAVKAGNARKLADVKKIYLDQFGTDELSRTLREQLIEQLRITNRFELPVDRDQADAVIKGEIRKVGNKIKFSLRLINEDGETIWSVESRPVDNQISQLANKIASELINEIERAKK